MVFLFRLLSWLPLSWLHSLGAVAGRLAFACSARLRRHGEENLAQAGLPASPLNRLSAAHAGRTLFELPKLWGRPAAEVAARVVRVSDWTLVEEAWAAGRGILFLTPHLGCFEITAQYYAAHRPMTVLYRRPKKNWLAPLMEAGRGANLKLAPADLSGVRSLIRNLRQGEAVGMLPDQVPGQGEGTWLPFFGRPAYTMTLAARLSETGATVLLAYAERLPRGAGYHLRLFPLPHPLTGTVEEKAAQINKALEDLIRQCPEQYLWGYNRYKRPSGAPPAPAFPLEKPSDAGQGKGT